MKVYRLEKDASSGDRGHLDAAPRWGLPGLRDCPGCGATWSTMGLHYPCVDLSSWPESTEYEEPRAEPHDELARLMEQLRPRVPPGTLLKPGTTFGPMTGRAKGHFTPIHLQLPWTLCLRREALEQLQNAGVQGLQGCNLNVSHREKSPPDLLELQLEHHGRFHPACLPADTPSPCSRCGRVSRSLPDPYLLDAMTLPIHVDVFRLADWPTLFLATERFVETARRLKLEGAVFREVPTR